ncbi:MAG: TonB-dependent receptor [Parasphingopyxis sp.]|nr:TonB-dependent receptor [Sphingomonadales bacterium]
MAAAPAVAQDAETPTDIVENADPTDDSDTGPAEENVIVVTAQGRTQQLKDVPIAVNAINSESLELSGANDLRQLNQLAPSLLVSSTGSEANGSARIRGVGTVGDNPGLESSVAVFIDGVYRSRTGVGLNELGAIDRVEVLRGPQGTLFGRNASAGLINIVSRAPSFSEEGSASATYGNYDHYRLELGLTGPIGDSDIAYRLDGVYVHRDGFYDDVVNGTEINDRDRYFVRGQLLWEANPDLEFRLIGDYTTREENCCAAVYATPDIAPANAGLLDPSNPIIPVLTALGLEIPNRDDIYERNVSITPGRSYAGETEDWGISLQGDWDLGFGELTSITAYREYEAGQAGDLDYGTVDILYRADDGDQFRRFETFSQELRLQGEAFGGTLDWLVGAYYANEDLTLRENLKFGSQYGAFAPCRVVLGVSPAIVDPSQSGCLSPIGRALLTAFQPFGPATQTLLEGLDRLATVNNVGDEGTEYYQNSENFAVFTHNIIRLSDEFDLTLGGRYTTENKRFSADFNNSNTICPAQRAALSPLLAVPDLAAAAGGLIALTCQGNSTSELNGLNLADSREEDEFTGTAIFSWRPTDDLLTYASYSRGYKAGGFNLDRSALNNPVFSPAVAGSTAALQFDPEIVDAFEIGAKYSRPGFTLNGAIFRQEFSNFQLNTFNGTVFLVQNINSCGTDLGGADGDADPATGACSPDDVQPGVISQGVELEATISPSPYFRATAGLTLADTSYENDLIGSDSGAPLDPALGLLPGDNMSNAPGTVVTGSVTWTPPIGNSGLSGLVYVDTRMTSDYNTGSDLFPQKEQDSYVLVNARVGLRGPDNLWSLEFWAQNLFDEDYTQVAFSSPFQAPNQIYSAYLAEPRTYGVTVRTIF